MSDKTNKNPPDEAADQQLSMDNNNPSEANEQDESADYIHPAQDFSGLGRYVITTFKIGGKPKYHLLQSDNIVHSSDDLKELCEKARVIFRTIPDAEMLRDKVSPKFIKDFGSPTWTPKPSIELYAELEALLRKYIEFVDQDWYAILPLWIMGTYIFKVFPAFPYLHVSGAMGSGKTKLCGLLERIVFNGLHTSSISEASIFRLVNSVSATIIIDEAEHLCDKHLAGTLRTLLNAGYQRTGKAYRQEQQRDGSFVSRRFELYAPKIIANIRGLEAVLKSRTIEVQMALATSTIGNTKVTDDTDYWMRLREDLYGFGLEHFSSIRVFHGYDEKARISLNRSNDLWSPLLAIASIVFAKNEDRLDALRTMMLSKIDASDSSKLDDFALAIILGIRQLVTVKGFYSNEQILRSAKNYLLSNEANSMRNNDVGYSLKNLGFRECKKRTSHGMTYEIDPEMVAAKIKFYKIEE